jgi:hypothetical protein
MLDVMVDTTLEESDISFVIDRRGNRQSTHAHQKPSMKL